MKKGITIAMVILCIGLAGIFVWNRVSSDRKAPEIEIGNENVVYKKGMDNAELLKGITAKDDKDGDVTDSLVVESIFESKDGKSVTVVYAAKDSSNNVGKVKRSLPCEGFEDTQEGEKQDNSADGQGEDKQPEAEEADTQPKEEGEQENSEQPEGNNQEQEPQENDPTAIPADQKAEIDALQPQQPKFYLKEYQVTVPVGTNLDKLSYVKDIADDSDNMDFLSRRIQIEDNLNTQVPGTYEVKYYVVDAQGNQSNVARLTVTVQ